MAEDDRFSKWMPKGYKRAYHNARKGCSENSVARALACGIARQMKEGSFDLRTLAAMLKELSSALVGVEERRGEFFHPLAEIRTSLHQTLEGIAVRHGFGASTQILREVALRTFEKLHSQVGLSGTIVQAAFCRDLTRTLTDHWCFAVTVEGVTARENLMRCGNLSAADQAAYESRICSAVEGVVANLIKQSLNSADSKPKRTPRLPGRKQPFSLSEMDQPLAEVELP